MYCHVLFILQDSERVFNATKRTIIVKRRSKAFGWKTIYRWFNFRRRHIFSF